MKMHRQVILYLGMCVAAASAAAGAPVAAAPTDSLAIRAGQAGARVSATQPLSMPSLGFDITRMLLALVIVIGLIYISRWFLKRFYNGATLSGGSRAVQVLNRTVLAPKQQVLLLQVGRRVVVVGDSNGNLATLAEIEDPDEIALLVGRLHDEKLSKSNAFGGLFGRAQAKMDEAGEESTRPHGLEDPAGSQNEVKSELSGLLEKVRTIRGQMGRD